MIRVRTARSSYRAEGIDPNATIKVRQAINYAVS
jgi:hypothetical protein